MLKINLLKSFKKIKNYKILTVFLSITVIFFVGCFAVLAGSLNPSSAPGDTMKTLSDIYCKIAGCTPGTYGIDSPGSPDSTMYTLEQIYNAVPDFQNSPGNAAVTDVRSGKTFYADSSTLLTGTQQCYEASLPSASIIKSGETVCGVTGTY